MTLQQYIPSPVVAIASTYNLEGMADLYVCGTIINENQLTLQFANGHQMKVGNLITVHLDNRTGVPDYDADLSVYRLSYKGQITVAQEDYVVVEPLQFEVFYGVSIEYQYKGDGYEFPIDTRVSKSLPVTQLKDMPSPDIEEIENKIGVLVTHAADQPHTTVMAFLSSDEDDIFFITFPNTFKSQLLKRDNRCYFAIDNRATFTFEEAIEWNYSLIAGEAFDVPKDSLLFTQIKEEFIAKNPWEVGFFSEPSVEMFHLKPSKVMSPKQG